MAKCLIVKKKFLLGVLGVLLSKKEGILGGRIFGEQNVIEFISVITATQSLA